MVPTPRATAVTGVQTITTRRNHNASSLTLCRCCRIAGVQTCEAADLSYSFIQAPHRAHSGSIVELLLVRATQGSGRLARRTATPVQVEGVWKRAKPAPYSTAAAWKGGTSEVIRTASTGVGRPICHSGPEHGQGHISDATIDTAVPASPSCSAWLSRCLTAEGCQRVLPGAFRVGVQSR